MIVGSVQATSQPLTSQLFFFFFNDTATTEIYTLSLHDALPICHARPGAIRAGHTVFAPGERGRSEEHTSELQSRVDLVCRLLLEKKKGGRIVVLLFLWRWYGERVCLCIRGW